MEEEEAKNAELASKMESNREAKINIEELKNDEEIDINDIWFFDTINIINIIIFIAEFDFIII